MEPQQQLVETFLFTQSPVVHIRVELDPEVITAGVLGDDAFAAPPFNTQVVGGYQSYGQLMPDFHYYCGDYQLVWQLELLGASVLHLCEFSVSSGSLHTVAIELPSPALPQVAFSAVGDQVSAYVALRNGVVLTFPFLRPSMSGTKAAGLKTLRAEAVSQCSLQEYWTALGNPSVMALISRVLCIAGKGNSILCVPLEYIKSRDAILRPFELRASSWGLKPMLQGVLSKSEQSGLIGLFPLSFGASGEHKVLGSVRQDGKLQLWDLQKKSQLHLEFPNDHQNQVKENAPALVAHWVQVSKTESLCFVQHHGKQASLHTLCYKVKLEAGKFVVEPCQPPPNQHLPLLDAAILNKRLSQQVWMLTPAVGGDALSLGFDEDAPEPQLLGFGLPGGQPVGQALLAETWMQRWLPPCTTPVEQDLETMYCQSLGCTAQQCLSPLLLAPGVLSRNALCDALASFGARLTPGEVQTASLSYLQSCVEDALASIAQHNPGSSLNQAWSTLSSTYLHCWRRRHSILRMVTLLDGSMLLLRAGLVVSVLRPAREVEISAIAPSLDPSPQVEAVGLLQQLMGSHLLGLASAQLLSGVDARVKLVPLLVRMLMTGPIPVLSQPHSDAAATEQREWRKVRRQLILLLNSSSESMAAMIREGAEALITSSGTPEDALMGDVPFLEDPGKVPPSPLACTLASTGGALVGWAQCAASLQLLVLAGIIEELKLLPPALEKHNAKSLGMLSNQIQSASLTLWMCTHPATPGAAKEATSDALEVLSRLHLSPISPAILPAVRSVSNCTLAASLLPLMCKQAPHLKEAVSSCTEAAAALVAYLQQGEPGRYSHTSVSQFLKAGYLLFQAREVGCLERLVQIAGEDAQRSAGLLFLQGLGLACQVGQASASARPQILTRATTLFFRAAASFRSGEGGDLREMLSDLRQELVSGGEEEIEQVEALLQLQLYEAVMLLFEREGAPDGAILFAQAAVEQLTAAYGEPLSETGKKHAGRLWSHVFSCSCDLKDYDAAYVAALSNPVPRDSVECLRRLVHCCCDDGQYLKLCGLPWAGTTTLLDRGGGNKEGGKAKGVQLALVQEAINIVHKRARHVEIAAQPSPYLLLYSFLTARSCHRKAAAVMVEFAERMKHEYSGQDCVHNMLNAYGCAIGSLELVDPASAWVHSSMAVGEGDPAAAKPMTVLLLDDLRREFARLSAAATVAQHASAPTAGGVAASPILAENAKDRSADDLFQQLLALHQYDAALTLAHNTWKGATLSGIIQRVLCALATTCVRSLSMQQEDDLMFPDTGSRQGGASVRSRGAAAEAVSTSGRPHRGPAASTAWRDLQSMLQVYYADCDQRSQLGLHSVGIAVADAVLTADRRVGLPPWLLDMLQAADARQGMAGPAANSASLLITYLKHDQLLQATELVVAHLTALATSDPRTRERHCATWMPHNIISNLHKRLSEHVERLRTVEAGSAGDGGASGSGDISGGLAVYESALRTLDGAMHEHVDLVEHHTQRLLAYGKAVAV